MNRPRSNGSVRRAQGSGGDAILQAIDPCLELACAHLLGGHDLSLSPLASGMPQPEEQRFGDRKARQE
jgi:hypothetical protein